MLKNRKETGRRAYRSSLLTAFVLILGFVMINTGIKADAAKAKFVKKAGRTYYYDAKGRKATGLKKIKGKWYYFSKKGVRYQKGWQTIKGKKYYFSKKNGAAYTGLKKISGKLYLFAKDGKRYGSGLITYSGKTYYVKGGNVQTGWRNLKGNRYCFSDQDGAALTGWQTVEGKEYYFDARGGMQKGQWIGDKYVGAKGYVTKEKGEKEKPGNTPGFQFPEKQEPVVEEKPHEVFYHEIYSDMIFNDINRFRESKELKPLKKATGTLLTQSILRGMYNIEECETIMAETGEGIAGVMASHGLGGQIGAGMPGAPISFVQEVYNEEINDTLLVVTNGWVNSAWHRPDIVSEQYDYMAVAVMSIDDGLLEATSIIVTFGSIQTDHYSVDGVDMGIFDMDTAPLYNYTLHRSYGDDYVSKEYREQMLEVPYEKWDEYLNSYKTIR